jgi:hypothetical protein
MGSPVSTQLAISPEQFTVPTWHAFAGVHGAGSQLFVHVPPTQVAPGSHALPHDPQLAWSSSVRTQTPEHDVKPGSQLGAFAGLPHARRR